MSKQIELTLSSLLPTVSLLPPEVLTLATSLLAQSRTKAAQLKPEEEIGRTYACCHIACQRLGHRFALEIAKPAPPVKPSVYNKLHTYFNAVLATPKTPSKTCTLDRVREQGARSSPRGMGVSSQPTSGKDTSANTVTTPTGKRKVGVELNETNVPTWVMPMIRRICKDCSVPELVPHVFAGVQSLLREGRTPTKKRKISTDEKVVESTVAHMPALVVAVFITVYGLAYTSEAADVEYKIQAGRAAKDYCDENARQLSFSIETEDALREEAKTCLNKNLDDWAKMEWYRNVPLLERSTQVDGQGEEADEGPLTPVKRPSKTPLRRKEKHAGRRDLDAESEHVGAAGLLPGLGTMFQPAVDWLSDEKRADFILWKKMMLRKGVDIATAA